MRDVAAEVIGLGQVDLEARPRARLEAFGAGALSNAELLTVLLEEGRCDDAAADVAEALLRDVDGLDGLRDTDYHSLLSRPGLARAGAARICAAVELALRLARPKTLARPTIASPEDAARILLPHMGALRVEHMVVVLLDLQSRLIRVTELYRGALDRSVARVSEVFRPAIVANAASLIVAHNHPSGDPTPSAEDLAFTRRCVQAGRMLGIDVADHLIIGAGDYVSMRARRLGFDESLLGR